jgi:hypothetical protein
MRILDLFIHGHWQLVTPQLDESGLPKNYVLRGKGLIARSIRMLACSNLITVDPGQRLLALMLMTTRFRCFRQSFTQTMQTFAPSERENGSSW